MNNAQSVIIGNLCADPEVKFTQSGIALAAFTVAVGSRKKNAAGEWEDGESSFFDVTAWRDLAEHVAESCQKGNRVVVIGRLEQQRWEKDGEKRSKIAVQADEVAVSLRFATAEVQRIERRKPEDGTPEPTAPSSDEDPF